MSVFIILIYKSKSIQRRIDADADVCSCSLQFPIPSSNSTQSLKRFALLLDILTLQIQVQVRVQPALCRLKPLTSPSSITSTSDEGQPFAPFFSDVEKKGRKLDMAEQPNISQILAALGECSISVFRRSEVLMETHNSCTAPRCDAATRTATATQLCERISDSNPSCSCSVQYSSAKSFRKS